MFKGRFDESPVIKWLLITNIAVFILDIMLTPEPASGVEVGPSSFFEFGAFTIRDGILKGQIWRLISFQFLHADFFHLLFNLYALFMFGPIVERHFKRSFLTFYLVTGLCGALLFSLLAVVPLGILPEALDTRLIGASAGVFGVLIGVAMIAPTGIVRLLFPPIPLTMRTFALGLIGIQVLLLLGGGNGVGGAIGHLGGALMGYLFFRVTFLRRFLESRARVSGSKGPRKQAAPSKQKKRVYEKKLKPRTKFSSSKSKEVDRILDKINEEGLHSLTEQERKHLQDAGKK